MKRPGWQGMTAYDQQKSQSLPEISEFTECTLGPALPVARKVSQQIMFIAFYSTLGQ